MLQNRHCARTNLYEIDKRKSLFEKKLTLSKNYRFKIHVFSYLRLPGSSRRKFDILDMGMALVRLNKYCKIILQG